MNKKVLKLVGKSGLALAAMPAVFGVGSALANDVTNNNLPENTKDIVVLHTNDIHGRIEENARAKVIGLAKLDGVVKEEKAKEDQITLLLDAGDAFQGLPISNSSKGLDMLEIMNNMDFDAIAVGNHEFDFELSTVKEYKEKLKFPLLSVNTYVDGARLFDTHTIIDKDKTVKGDEFVVIGVTTPETATKTHPRNVAGVEFRDPITEVNNVIKEIEAKAKAANVEYKNYVVLAHMGIDATTPDLWKGSTLAKALAANELLKSKNVLLIDGHSHTVHTDKFGHVIYNQTGSYLENIGKIVMPNKGEIVASNLSYKDVKDVKPTEKIAKMVADVKEKFEDVNKDKVIDNNPVKLEGDRSHVRVRETNLGNAIADALYEYGQTGFSNKTDLAVTNGGGIRSTIEKGKPVTKGDIISVLPFGNIISQIEVTGQQIKEMFSKSFSAPLQLNKDTKEKVFDENNLPLLEPNGPFLHTSGVKLFYDTTKPEKERVLDIFILNKETKKYEKLDLNKKYYLATNDFIAAGGDGYTMLNGAREEGPSMDEVFAKYLINTDLSKYTVVNPNERLVSISEKDYIEKAKEEKSEKENNLNAKEIIHNVVEKLEDSEVEVSIKDESNKKYKVKVQDVTESHKKEVLSKIEGKVDSIKIIDIDLLDANTGDVVKTNKDRTVRITLVEDLENKSVSVYYVDNNGDLTLVPSTVENGTVVFSVNHFSKYAITISNKEKPLNNSNKAKSDNSSSKGTSESTPDNSSSKGTSESTPDNSSSKGTPENKSDNKGEEKLENKPENSISKEKSEKKLPNTGVNSVSTMVAGLAILGIAALLRRKVK